ncbi:hypothetical protein BH23BAC1_BH23BAC1_16800 [soil metagenome]
MENPTVMIKCSEFRSTGLLTTFKKFNKAVSNFGKQEPPKDIGIESFEFWIPQRRPEGHNLAFKLNNPLSVYSIQNLSNGIFRPTIGTNAWAGALQDPSPTIKMEWPESHEFEEL